MPRRPSVGFPRMNKESGEKRVFLPAFIQYLTRFADVYLEEGYGSRSGFTFDDYRQGNPRVYKTDLTSAFQKDFILVLRSPNENEFQMIPRGSCLVSMLHYPTRPGRVQYLRKLGLEAIVDLALIPVSLTAAGVAAPSSGSGDCLRIRLRHRRVSPYPSRTKADALSA